MKSEAEYQDLLEHYENWKRIANERLAKLKKLQDLLDQYDKAMGGK